MTQTSWLVSENQNIGIDELVDEGGDNNYIRRADILSLQIMANGDIALNIGLLVLIKSLSLPYDINMLHFGTLK